MSGAKEGLLVLARVLKANGTEGEVILGFRDFLPSDIDQQEPVYIFFDGLPVPFFFEQFSPRGTRAAVRLTGIRSLEDAEEITGREVYGSEEIYEIEDEVFPSLEGWTLLDADGSIAGTVTDHEDIPGNPCIYVDTGSGAEAMIPLNEDLVIGIDEKNRQIRMTIPDGLI